MRAYRIAVALLLLSGVAPAWAKPAALPFAGFAVCRLPGGNSAAADGAITVPAGTEYDEGGPDDAALRLVTTAPAVIAANEFCVTVAVKPLGQSTSAVLAGSAQAMFTPRGNWRGAGADPVNLTYGYWRAAKG
jgi:hypothetical protein